MKRIGRYIGIIAWVTTAMLAVSCSEDNDHSGVQRRLHLVLGQQVYSETNDQVTRALPANFLTYNDLYQPLLPLNAQIEGLLAKAGNEAPEVGLFSFTDTGEPKVRSWSTRMQIDSNGEYFLYGFLPKEGVGPVNIAPYNGNYSNGAVLTINEIDAITPNDLCVIVGVQGASNNTLPITNDALAMETRLGEFGIRFEEEDNEKYAYLLADHIFCGLNFLMSIDAEYSKLRTIKVKRVELLPADAENAVKKVKAVVTLVSGQGNPLAAANGGSISVTTTATGTPDNPARLLDDDKEEPMELTTTAKPIRGCFAPGMVQKFKLRTLYDVYDRNGKLVRPNQVSENTLSPTIAMSPGQQFTYEIMVSPTYLYSLSEQDLDSPTFKVVD